jgi:hypothetical protein
VIVRDDAAAVSGEASIIAVNRPGNKETLSSIDISMTVSTVESDSTRKRGRSGRSCGGDARGSFSSRTGNCAACCSEIKDSSRSLSGEDDEEELSARDIEILGSSSVAGGRL